MERAPGREVRTNTVKHQGKSSQQMVPEKHHIHIQKKKADSNFTPYTNSEKIKDLRLRAKTLL